MNLRVALCIALAILLLGTDAAWGQQTSRSTFTKLMDVQELWGEDRYDEALAMLQKLAADNVDKPYDHAVTQQYIAHTAMLGDRMELVRPALQKALSTPSLPPALEAELNLFYGQIVLGDEEFKLGLELLEKWYAYIQTDKTKVAQPAQLFSLGYANYMIGNLPRAEVLLLEAVSRERNIRNSWYRIYYQVLFDQKKYDLAEEVIFGLVTRDPNNEVYWRMLANHFLQIEASKEALAAMRIADIQGLLGKPKDRERLASLYGYIEIPEKSARILEAAILDEQIEEDADTLRRLGDLWLLARDRERALDYLARSAAQSEDGKTFELVGSLLFEDEQWAEARAAYVRALRAGGLEEPERVHLLAGMSAYNAGDNQAARESFNEARKSDKHRSQALAMLRQLNDS